MTQGEDLNFKKYGITTNCTVRNVFEWVNKRTLCEKCRKDRYKIDPAIEEKEKKNNFFSNLILGLSSESIEVPLDLLIIGEAHGGRPDAFRTQKSLEKEVEYIADYYLFKELLEKFHQKEMRDLFEWLDEQRIKYVFTDLVKCYVWRKNNENFEIAIERCSEYLQRQVDVLQPRIILVLGKKAQKQINKWHFKQNKPHIINSIFPSMFTADKWVKTDGWAQIKKEIQELYSKNRTEI